MSLSATKCSIKLFDNNNRSIFGENSHQTNQVNHGTCGKQLPLRFGLPPLDNAEEAHDANFLTWNFNTNGEAQSNYLNVNIPVPTISDNVNVRDLTFNNIGIQNSSINSPSYYNDITEVPTGNFNFTNANLNGTGQAPIDDSYLNENFPLPGFNDNVNIQDSTFNGNGGQNSHVNSCNGITGVPTENFNFTSPNLIGLEQTQTASNYLNGSSQLPNFNGNVYARDSTSNSIVGQNSNVNSQYNLNGIRGVSSGNFNSTNPALIETEQAQTADVNSLFLQYNEETAPNVSMQPQPGLVEEDSDLPWFSEPVDDVVTSRSEVPVLAVSNSSGKEFASVKNGSAAIQMGESSGIKRRAIEVPLTIREATPPTYSQQVPRVSAAQVNLQPNSGIPNALYDPVYESLGLPIDPLLRKWAEVEKQWLDRNKDK